VADLTLAACGLPSWDELGEFYSQFERDVAGFVARWTYAAESAGLERPEPFWLERSGRRPAPLVDQAPQDPRGVARYGLPSFDNVPLVSELSDAEGQVDTVWLRWMVNRVDLRLRFSVADAPPKLTEVVIEHRLGMQLTETIAFTDEGRVIHRESYQYDARDRLSLIESTDGTPDGVSARRFLQVSHGKNGPRFTVLDGPPRELRGDGSPRGLSDLAPPAVDDAAARIVTALSAAIAAWCVRQPRAAEITRVMLLHDWPVNPPFPGALIARSGQWSDGDTPYEFFDPDPEIEAWFDADPREFRSPRIRKSARILNDWFADTEPERSPFDLLVEISRAARHEIVRRTGRDVWVLPVDQSWTDVGAAAHTLLPPDLAAPIRAALSASEHDD
jgi:hypothetical protein